MSKEQILERYWGSRPVADLTDGERGIIFAAMEDYAKQVLGFVMNANENGVNNDPTLKIDMVCGEFYWESDRDGDQPLGESEILFLYEKPR